MSDSDPIRTACMVLAGRGSRLRPHTDDRPKCLVEVGGRSMLSRALDALQERGVEDFVFVLGYRWEDLAEASKPWPRRLVRNPFWATTNNMGSLWMARHELTDRPFLYLHGDLVFEPEILDRLLEAPASPALDLVVDDGPVDEEAMKVRVDDDGRFVESSKQVPLDAALGEWIGLARFSAEGFAGFCAQAEELLMAGDHQAYDTAAFNRMAANGAPVGIVPTGGLGWREVDDATDLAAAEEAFGG